jgi:hypothetical protein
VCSGILTGIMHSASMYSASIVLSTCWVSALEHGAKTLVVHGIRFHESMICLIYCIFFIVEYRVRTCENTRVD